MFPLIGADLRSAYRHRFQPTAVVVNCSGICDSRSASRDDFLYRLAQLEVWPKAADGRSEATGREGLSIQVLGGNMLAR